MKSDYKQPTLTGVFNVLGFLTALGAIIAFIAVFASDRNQGEGLMTAFGLLLSAMIEFGIAQVINFIGETAYNTGKMREIMESQAGYVSKPLGTTPAGNRYYYMGHGESPLGPVSVAVLRKLALEKQVSTDSLVCLEGSEDWKPLGQVVTL